VHYTTPRQYTIERLPNGKFRVFHYGPGLSSLHDSLVEAYRHCGVRYHQSGNVWAGDFS
jgi:hypothetical protein